MNFFRFLITKETDNRNCFSFARAPNGIRNRL